MNSGRLVIRLFDVGHGDHILLEFPSGDIGVVDCSFKDEERSPRAIDYLLNRSRFANEARPVPIKFFCISHPHSDHIRGLSQFLGSDDFQIEELWHSMSLGTETILTHLKCRSLRVFGDALPIAGYQRANSELLFFLRYIRRAFITNHPRLVSLMDMRQLCALGETFVECVGPSERALRRYLKRIRKDTLAETDWAVRQYGNRISGMLLITYGKNRVLLTGDAMKPNWAELYGRIREVGRLDELPYEVIKAPHHGSKHSYTPAMWRSVIAHSGIVCVSALGVSTPIKEFYSLAGRRRLYCTNAGPCLSKSRGIIGHGCCGDITVSVGQAAGDIRVATELRYGRREDSEAK